MSETPQQRQARIDAIRARIEMRIGDWNQIITLLTDHPYRVVAPLIGQIIEQAKPYLPPDPPGISNGPIPAPPEADHVPH
jgi:hypothetical protein